MKKTGCCIIILLLLLIIFMSCTENMQPTRTIVELHYADWCPHCQVMKPIWQQTKANINSRYPDILFREIDEQKTPTPGISGIPTIRLINQSGKTYKYPGGPNAEKLQAWILAPIH